MGVQRKDYTSRYALRQDKSQKGMKKARAMTTRGGTVLQPSFFASRRGKKGGGVYQNAISLFLENFMNSSSDAVVTASRMVAMAEATPSLPCTTLV